jgi:hypothetical protein
LLAEAVKRREDLPSGQRHGSEEANS